MKLIIIRHGQTVENSKNICQGQGSGTLSKLGIQQAKKLGERLKIEQLDAVYSSDLERAFNTAKYSISVHKDRKKLKIIKDKRLRERYLGKIQGKEFPEGWNWKNLPQYCETDKELCYRVKEFLDDIYEKHKNQTVLVSCHGGSKMALITVLQGNKSTDLSDLDDISNASVSVVEFKENNKHKILLLNCINHL